MIIPPISVERKGEILLFLSSVIFAFISLFVKIASNGASGLFIATWRFIVGVIVTFLVVKFFKIPTRIENKKEWVLRGIFGSAAMVCFYLSIQITTISRASLLCNTSPVFVALFGFLFFREKIRMADIFSLVICFTGIIFIFYDREKYVVTGDIFGLLSGIFSGIAIHYVKRSSMLNHALIVYLSPCLLGLIFIPFTISSYNNLTMINFLMIIFIGLLTLAAQYFMTSGYKYVNPTKGSILNYLQIPLTIVLGAIIIHDSFPKKMIIGMVLVFAGLLISIFKISNPIKKPVQK